MEVVVVVEVDELVVVLEVLVDRVVVVEVERVVVVDEEVVVELVEVD